MKKILIWAFLLQTAEVHAKLCDQSKQYCGWVSGRGSSAQADPSTSSKISINPSAVPVEKGYGLEIINFKSSFDYVVVKGFGRAGAAISPSNGEETFFGPPGIELPEDYLERRQERQKFPSQKINLATAFTIFNNKRRDLKRKEVNIGVMGKYNQATKAAHPGGGINGVLGPLTFGYSLYKDETQLDFTRYGSNEKPIFRYSVDMFSVGMFFGALALDYSVLHLRPTELSSGPELSTDSVSTMTALSASLILKRAIFTLAKRTEDSQRPGYDYATRSLVTQQVKNEIFAAAQFSLTNHLMLGAFFNYYLLHEISAAVTIFL